MKLAIDKKTPLAEIYPFIELITDEQREDIKKHALKHLFDGTFWNLKIGVFFVALQGETSALFGKYFNENRITAYQYFCLLAFRDFVEDFTKVNERYAIKPTAEEEEASAGLPEMTIQESIFIFCRSYFGLRSFDEVEGLRMSDWVIAKKDNYCKQMYDRNHNKIMQRKFKSKSK